MLDWFQKQKSHCRVWQWGLKTSPLNGLHPYCHAAQQQRVKTQQQDVKSTIHFAKLRHHRGLVNRFLHLFRGLVGELLNRSTASASTWIMVRACFGVVQ